MNKITLETNHNNIVLADLLGRFLDSLATTTGGRGNFHDSGALSAQAEYVLHTEVFNINRGLYAVMLMLPGVRDHARRVGIVRLLSTPIQGPSILDANQEKEAIARLLGMLPIQRRLKAFAGKKDSLAASRVNNRRARGLVLKSLLADPLLPFHATKYGKLINGTLTHVWGQKNRTVIKNILAKAPASRNTKERFFLKSQLLKYSSSGLSIMEIEQAISYALGNRKQNFTVGPLQAVQKFKEGDIESAKEIAPEVVLGLMGGADENLDKALENSMTVATGRQKVRMAKAARAKSAEVNLSQKDLADLTTVELYVHLIVNGLSDNTNVIRKIYQNAISAASIVPLEFERIGIVVDNSISMGGTDKQRGRDLAVALAMRDILGNIATMETVIETTNGSGGILPTAGGATNIASAFKKVLQRQPHVDVVYILSDGFENQAAGRFAEMLDALRQIGWDKPVYQMTPTLSAKAFSSRPLSGDVLVVPVNDNINSFGLGMLKDMLVRDFEAGLTALVGKVMPQLTSNNQE